MKIIGHRGAAGLATENTAASFQKALDARVDAIELDVRKTKDNHLVVFHDSDTKRLSDTNLSIAKSTLKQLQKLKLTNGERIITLKEVFALTGDTHLIIELKSRNSAKLLVKLLSSTDLTPPITIASFRHDELRIIREALPDMPFYVLEHHKPFEIVASARKMRATGIGLNAWLLNPLTYWLCRRGKLDLYVYTVNSVFIAAFLNRLYPLAMICTDRPDRFNKHRKLLRKITA